MRVVFFVLMFWLISLCLLLGRIPEPRSSSEATGMLDECATGSLIILFSQDLNQAVPQ